MHQFAFNIGPLLGLMLSPGQMFFFAVATFRINIDLVPSFPSTVKLEYCEKAKQFKKNLPPCWRLLSNVKSSPRFLKILLAFSENLNSTAKNVERTSHQLELFQ